MVTNQRPGCASLLQRRPTFGEHSFQDVTHELLPFTGRSAGLVHDILPAGELVVRMVSEAELALTRSAEFRSLGGGHAILSQNQDGLVQRLEDVSPTLWSSGSAKRPVAREQLVQGRA
jgi:hypothetical protein